MINKLLFEKLQRWAFKNGWKVYTLFNERGNVEWHKYDKIIEWGGSNNSLVTEIIHPKQGLTRLYRKDLTCSQMKRIFYYPRTHTSFDNWVATYPQSKIDKLPKRSKYFNKKFKKNIHGQCLICKYRG